MSTKGQTEVPTQPIPGRVFLNYASEDREWAVWLQTKLLEAGLIDVWLDRTEIEGGEDWKNEINDGLRECVVLLALITNHSIDPSRQWVEYERSEADRLLKPIIPLRFGAEPPEHLKHVQYIDFTDDKDAAFSALMAVIRKHALRSTGRGSLPGQLPQLEDAFVGREMELKDLVQWIENPTGRVETAWQSIAIQGMGGQGKTMLAEELVRRLAPRYPGGVIIERRGQSPEPERAVLEKWATLALGQRPTREYQAADVRSLLAGYGQLLVLIDDVSESDFKATRVLIKEALPHDATRILTTRSKNIKSELGCRMYELTRLKDEDAHALVQQRICGRTIGCEDGEEAIIEHDVVQRLVDLVQGHALALEVTAARCNFPEDLPDVVDQLAASLKEGLDDLKVDVAESNKDNSLAVSLNISLDQLREYDRAQRTTWAERFAALGVFPDSGRMNRELIAAVWGDAGGKDNRTNNALNGLHRRAMIKREPKNNIYLSHPLLRAFARSLLRKEPDRLAATQRRYRDFLIRTAEQGFRQPEGEWSQMKLYTPHLLHTAEELWAECTPLLGDLNALAQPEGPPAKVTLEDPAAHEITQQSIRFAQAVLEYVLRRPTLGDDGLRILKLGLACARATNTEELLDTFLRSLGIWYARTDPQAAERYFEQALRFGTETRDRAEQGKLLSDYGELQRNRSKLDVAIELLNRALAIHEELGDLRMQAATRKSLGETYWRLCDFDVAMDQYHRAIELYRNAGDASGEADLRNKIGSVEFNRGNYKDAIPYFHIALHMHHELGNRSMEGEDLNDMGISFNYLGEPEFARPLLEEAIEIHSQLGNRRLEAIARSNLAATFYALGRQDQTLYEQALLEASKSVDAARDIECKFTEVWSLNWEALAHQELGRPQVALPLLKKAVDLLDEAGGPRERVSTWGNYGYLLGKHLGQQHDGVSWLTKAIELMRANQFKRAFGGRTLDELENMLQDCQTKDT